MKRNLLSVLGVLLLGTTAFSQVGNYTVGQSIGNFTVTDVHGTTHTLYDYTAQGKIVILDFFFTTCGPCQQNVPNFTEFYNKYGCNEGDVVLLAIDNGDTDAEVIQYELDFAGTNPAPSASGIEGGGNAVVSQFGISAYPTYCLIGDDNKLKNADIWPVTSIVELETAVSNAGYTISEQSCAASLVDQNEIIVDMNVYPNPANENASISVNSQTAYAATLNVLDFQGRVVLTQPVFIESGTTLINLNMSAIENGQYMVQLAGENNLVSTTKLMIQK